MHIRIHNVGRCIHLLSFFEFQRAREAHEIEISREGHWDDWSARSFLRQHFHGSYEFGALRSALARDIHDVSRMSDDDIVAAAAQRLCSGAWRIGYDRWTPAATAPAGPTRAAAAGIGAAPRQGMASSPSGSVRRSRTQAPLRPSAKRDTVPTAAAPEDVFQSSDQAAMADTLLLAAAAGAAFCEICAKARQ